MNKIAILSVLLSVTLMVIVASLTRNKKLREQNALLWFAISAAIFLFSFIRKPLNTIANWMGIYYPPSLLIVASIFIGIFIGIHFSIIISKLEESNKKLTQEIGLIRNKIEKIEKELEKSR